MGNSSGDETRPTESGIASDDTQLADPSNPTPSNTTGRVIRASRSSVGPSRLGRYAIVRPLGRGGMGAVYEAEDPELGRRVAIKVLREDRDDARFTEQLRREAQALAKLVHPNVVGVHDVGVEGGQVFVVMQLVDGETIDRWLRARRAGASQIVAAFRQAGQGLAAAHAAGLVHCDFKPANVLVDKDGVVRVSDFGLARIGEEAGAIAGTPAYMAPEQFAGTATAASDQYSFCVALWEVLAGSQPFPESSIESAGAREIPPMPRAARVPPRVVRALERGLAKDPAQRFASMDELLAALAPPAHRGAWIAGGVGTLAVAGGVIAFAVRPAPVAEPPKQLLPGEPDLAAARALTKYDRMTCAYAPTIDGERVVFDRTRGEADDIYTIPLAGGAERQLTSAAPMEWRAHAGRRPGEVLHLVTDAKEQTANVSYLDLETGQETVAADVAASDAVLTNRGIVYTHMGAADLRRIEGAKDVLVSDPPKNFHFGQLAVSNNRERVAAIAESETGMRLCLVDVAFGKAACGHERIRNARPAFGADDRFLYYAGKDGIRRRELATAADELFVPDASPSGGIAISGDGATLVYSDCGARSQIVDWSTMPPARLVDDPQASSVNGTRDVLVWVRSVRGVPVVVMRDAAGVERQISDPAFGPATHPSLSPDAHWIAFESGPPHPGIYITTANRPDALTRMSDNPQDRGPVWINNEWLGFNREDEHQGSLAYVVRIDGASLHPLSSARRKIIGGHGNRVLLISDIQMYWADLATGHEQLGPQPAALEGMLLSSVALSASGNWFMVAAGNDGHELYRMRLDPPGKLEKLPDVSPTETITGRAITDDGHVLLVTATWSGDLHVIPAKPGTRF